MNCPLISVIIPTRNSGQTIDACLKSIKKQSYKNVEIIVIDNNSSDDTKKIAKAYGYVFDKGPERSAQRNYGAKKSKGNFLLFIDSDMILSKNVLKSCIIKSKNVGGIIIPEKSIGIGFFAKVKAFERSFYIGNDLIEAARFFPRKTFFNFKGYDESISGGGEDWDLPLRIKKAGNKIERIKDLIIHNEGRLSLINLMKKKFYYSKTISKYIKKHPDVAKQQINLFNRFLNMDSRRLFKNPLMGFSVIFVKSMEFLAGGLGFVYSKIKRGL